MSKPFSDEIGGGATSPVPASAASSNSISYQPNINRQKTTKWVNAKPADYGADDWGDDYEEYNPPSLFKSTGVRQPGQSVQLDLPTSPVSVNKPYGDLQTTPANSQWRSVTAPVQQQWMGQDVQRVASHGQVRQPIASAVDASQQKPLPALQVVTQPTVTGLRKPIQTNSPADSPSGIVQGKRSVVETPQSGIGSSIYSDDRVTPVDYTNRAISPGAAPPPSHARFSPIAQSPFEPPATNFPLRKASLSSQTGTDVSEVSQHSLEGTTPKPWVGARPSSPGSATKSPTTQGKPLPFIRPADIYKRMEEERTRERQSSESSRPNVDSPLGRSSSREQSASPANSTQPTRLDGEKNSDSVKPVSGTDHSHIDDGRHVRAVLDPVQERKSETGFDSFNTNNPATAGKFPEYPVSAINRPGLVEEEYNGGAGRFSTTPMLPDLNRISMFGMDLFSPTKLETVPPVPDVPSEIQAQSLHAKNQLPTQHEESNPTLHPQASPGFTSIVHQAFDNQNDLSVPHTPIGSGVKRSDSESTGTTGISPIMSRVPSTAKPETRNREVDSRDATPAIAEETEPESKRSSSHLPALSTIAPSTLPRTSEIESATPHSFQSGQRREMTPPSPGNVLARTPTVTSSSQYPAGEEGQISAAPESAASSEAELGNARQAVERDQSFRPALPGGWVSYATTQDDMSEQQKGEKRPESPASSVSHAEVRPDNNVNVTPHTNNQSGPSSTLGVVAGITGAALGGAVVSKLHTQDKGGPPLMPDVSQGPWAMSGNKSAQTPDPALAPVTNPYSATAVDPRLTSTEETAVEKTQISQNDGMAASMSTGTPPTPPPKDMPSGRSLHRPTEYFPAPNPLKLKTQGNPPASEPITSTRPQVHILPALSTQASPHDLESDRLRKEIARSLSPTNPHAGQSQRFFGSDNPDQGTSRDDVGQSNSPHESSYLPSEYDNYWASSDEPHRALGKTEEQDIPQPMSAVSDMSESSLRNNQGDEQQVASKETAPVAAASANVPATSISSGDADTQVGTRPPMTQNRFSWDNGSEQVTTPGSQLKQLKTAGVPESEDAQVLVPSKQILSDAPQQQITNPVLAGERSSVPENQHARQATEAAVGVGALTALATAAYVGQQTQKPEPQRRLSLAEEKSPANASTYAVSTTPPEDEHPSRSTEQAVTPSTLVPSDHRYTDPAAVSPLSTVAPSEPHRQPSTVTPSEHPRQQVSDMSKITQFSDILSYPTAELRIRAYNNSRDQFAIMETGLSDWLRDLNSRYTELSGSSPGFNFAPSAGGSVQSRPAKSPGNQSQPLQQPYYQQYLNASSPTMPANPNSRPSTSNLSGSQQGPSPSGGKQGQSKTKIFSGKGLFGKSKNKFRGGDKKTAPADQTSSEIPNKMRQSWESPNALARSSGGASSQGSGDRTPSHESHSRSASRTEPGSLQPGGLVVEDNRRGAESVSSISTLPVRDEDRFPREDEARDSLGVPAPIGKHQPTWDPTNATPIAEEDGFQLDEQTLRGSQRLSTGVSQQQAFSMSTTSPNTGRSASSGDAFLNAAEEPNSDDWVMVSKAEEAGLVTSNVERPAPRTPAMLAKEEEEGLPPSAVPPPERQRSSSHSREPSGVSSIASVSTIPPEYRTLPGQLDQQPLYNTGSSAPNMTTVQPQGHPTENPIYTNQNRDQEPPNASGFVPLPPIRRNSTFDVGKTFALTDDNNTQSLIASPGITNRDSNQATSVQAPVGTVLPDHSNSGKALLQNPSAPQTATSANNDHNMQYLSRNANNAVPSDQVQVTRDQRALSAASQQRPSLEGQNERTPSWTNHRPTNSVASQVSGHSQAMQRPNSASQNLFEQPPSSAQRFPELFRPEQPGNQAQESRGKTLPAHYYQAPVSREEAFLPRQNTNEYSLPGVGPPDDPRQANGSKGLLKDLGGKLPRSNSRDRNESELPPMRRNDTRDSQGSDFLAQSIRTNEDGDKKKKRTSLLGAFSLGSADAKPESQRRESIGTFGQGSRTDSMPPTGSSTNPTPEKKRGFFGSKMPRTSTSDSLGPSPSGGSPNAPSRTSTSEPSPSQSGGKKSKLSKTTAADNSSPVQPAPAKKNRFSGLSNILGRSSGENAPPIVDNAVKTAQDPRQYQRPLNYDQMQRPGQDPRNLQNIQGYSGPQGPQGPQSQQFQTQGLNDSRAPLALQPIGQGPQTQMAQRNYQGPGPMQAPTNAGGFPQLQQVSQPLQFSQDPRMVGQQPPGQQPQGQQPFAPQPPNQQQLGQQMGRQPMGQQPMGQQPIGQQPIGLQQPRPQPLGQQPPGQQPLGQQPLGQQPLGQQPLGQQPLGQQPLGHQPLGQQQPLRQQQPEHSPTSQQQLRDQPIQQPMSGFQDPRTLQRSPGEASQQILPSQDPRVGSQVHPTGLGIQQPQERRNLTQLPASNVPIYGFQDPKQLNQQPSPGSVPQGHADPRLSGPATPPGQLFFSQDQRNLNQMATLGRPIQAVQDPRLSNSLSPAGQGTQTSPEHRNMVETPPARSPLQMSPAQGNLSQFSPSQNSQEQRQERRPPPQVPVGTTPDYRTVSQQQTPQHVQALANPQVAPLGAEEFPMRPVQQPAPGFGAPNQGMKSNQNTPVNAGPGIGQAQPPPTQPPQETRKKGGKFFGGLLGRRQGQEQQGRKAEPVAPTQMAQSAQPKFNPQWQNQQRFGPSQQPQQRFDPAQQPQQRFDTAQHPQQRFDPAQQQQQRFDSAQQLQPRFDPGQQPRQSLQNFDALQDAGRGRQLMRGPQQETPPIPGGYEPVRGEGYLAPTYYNPQQPVQPLQPQHRQQQSLPGPSFNNQQQQFRGANYQAVSGEPQDKLGPRPLSSDDVLARSPARPQFGQQRPYQLSLPHDDDEISPNGQLQTGRPTSAERAMPTNGPLGNSAMGGIALNGMPNTEQPLIRHPQSPATYPLPESAFSPVNPAAQNFPNPPAPQWPVSQPRGREQSNPEASPVSQLSGRPQSTTSGPVSPNQKLSVYPPSQKTTPDPNVDEDIYTASPKVAAPTLPLKSPRRSNDGRKSTDSIPGLFGNDKRAAAAGLAGIVTTAGAGTAVAAAAGPAKEDRNLELERDQEEKILWDPEGATEVRPPTPDPIMSATSYPGDEWNPYGVAMDGDEFD